MGGRGRPCRRLAPTRLACDGILSAAHEHFWRIEGILLGIRSIPRRARPFSVRSLFVSHGSAAHLRKGNSMANTADTADSGHHLMDQERFEIGGRDTVLLVWSLIAGIVVGFLLLVH